MTRWVLLLALLSVGCFSTGGRSSRIPPQRDPLPVRDPAPTVDASAEQAVIDRTNRERERAGRRPLTMDPQLTEAAHAHAANMARRDRMAHTLNGKTVADRVKATGYAYRAVGENIAWNQLTAKEVMADWMSSSGHRRNILSDEFTQIGVAVATNAKGEPYWVQVFGAPRR